MMKWMEKVTHSKGLVNILAILKAQSQKKNYGSNYPFSKFKPLRK